MKLKNKLRNSLKGFTLNPRVSVFRHNGGIYLFDSTTYTYASMNEVVFTFITKPEDTSLFDELPEKGRKKLADIIEIWCRSGILIPSESIGNSDRLSTPDFSGSMTNLAIFVTTKCNLKCAYCYAWGGDSGKTISKDIWRLAMDHFFSNLKSNSAHKKTNRKSIKMAIHGGGEPTVEFTTLKQIVAEFSGRAQAVGLHPSIGMGTNGTYGDSVHRWIIENNIGVNISLDGARDIQNILRPFRSGQPSYQVVVRNIRKLVQAGRSASVRTTVTTKALESMEDTVKLAKQLGIASVHFEPVSLTGRCATSAVSRPDAGQFAEKFLKCFILGLKLNVDIRYSGMRCFERHHNRFCSACGQNFCVTPDGNITTCYEVLYPTDPAASAFFIGKVDPSHGKVVLNQNRIKKLKSRVAENMESCKGCFLKYHCAGDCLVKSFRYSNRDLYSPDPYRCQIADRINKQLVVWLADGIIEPRDINQIKVMSLNQDFI